tara:strand:+ start:23 stop:949 length:927 start_codon:yes stop_codon:yes gene_type:complete
LAKIIILNLKGFFSNHTPLLKIFLLLGLLFLSFFLHHLLALGVVSLLYENGFDLFFSYDLTSQTSVNILKIIQFFSATGTFITPLILYGYLTNFQYGFKTYFSRQAALLSIGVVLLIAPIVSFLIEFNMSINFPNWMLKFDKDSEVIVLAFLKMDSFIDLLVNLTVMAIIPAIGEELFFRGFVQKNIHRVLRNPHIAIIVTSILFSLIHFHLNGLIPRFILGCVLGYMFYWTKSLWIPIIAHFTNNALAIIISYPYFKSFDMAQNFNHYSETDLPQITDSAIIFSLFSVGILLYLLFRNSKQIDGNQN